MSIRKALVEARRLLDKRSNWTQGVSARDKQGMAIYPDSPEAVSWCLTGALHKVLAIEPWEPIIFLNTLKSIAKITIVSVSQFNDSRTHQEVLEALDKTIAKCPR